MANGPTHSLVAAVTVGTYLGWSEKHCGEQSAKPIAGAVLAGGLTKLPDILEPARHPHHSSSVLSQLGICRSSGVGSQQGL